MKLLPGNNITSGYLNVIYRINRIKKNLFMFFPLILFSCSSTDRDTYTLKPVDLDYTVLASCTVIEPEPYNVMAKAGGDIISLNVKQGDRVEKDQVLAQIDDYREQKKLIIDRNSLDSVNLRIEDSKKNELPRLNEQLKKDAATLKNSERYLQRLKQLKETGGVSEAELENAEESYKQAQAKYNQTVIELDTFGRSGKLADLETERRSITARIELDQKAIDDMKVKAPYSGVITDVFSKEGETVQDNAPLMRIIEDREWEIEANIDQKDLPYVRKSQEAFIVLDAYPSVKISAQVIHACVDVDISRGSCRIRLKINDRHDFIRYGMTGNVEIIADRFKAVLAAPSQFLKRQDGSGYVNIMKDNSIQAVKIGFREVGEKWVILEGLPESTTLYDPLE